ncbi:MAG: ion transporter [Candidatus Kapabacteria bacterium]|nr:ion transporter [Ignavibacteriota bacterium]MCW5883720.1 ion transporter [Candidatus Kapabacteria bacterium]
MKLGYLDIIIFFLSIYILGALLLDTFFQIHPETSRLLYIIDFGICFIFLIDFFVQFYRAENKLKFMKWGWIDLIASLPALDIFRAGRLFRLVRIFRIIKAFRSVHNILNYIFANKVQGTFTSLSVFVILLIIFSAIAILQLETSPESNIKTAEDAIWWSYVTVTTVGYGDKYPVTTEGRLLAVILITAGVGMFGTFTAYVSSWFVKDKEEEADIKKETN